jgi:hypothetical protein
MERERQNSIESIHDSDDPLSSGGPSSRAGSIQTSGGSSSEDENGEAEAEEKADLAYVNLLNEQTWTMTSSELNRIKQDLLQVGPRSKPRLKSSSEDENGEADAEEEDLVNLLKGSFNEQTWTMTSSELNRIKQDLLKVGPRTKPRLKSSSEDENGEADTEEEELLNLLNVSKIRQIKEQTWTMTSSELNRIQQDLLQVGPCRTKPRLKSPPPPSWRLTNRPHPPARPQRLLQQGPQKQQQNRSRTAMRNDASSSFHRDGIDGHVRGNLPALCSIPEDGQTTGLRMRLYEDDDEEEEPMYHRSPVTLDNGYRPRGGRVNECRNPREHENSDLDKEGGNEDTTSTDEETAEFKNPGSGQRTLSLWRICALVIYVLRCLMTVLFLAAVFVIFVLLTHEPSINYGREIRYLH